MTASDLYKEEILDHYKNPRNFGEMTNPTVSYQEDNPLCGDRLFLQLIIDGGKVTDVRFKGEGCAISTASASLMTEYIKGKTLPELEKLRGEDVLEILGIANLSPARLKCALLPLEGLRHALTKYQSLTGNN